MLRDQTENTVDDVLINIGERAGSGVPNIFNVWSDEGWVDPVIEEQFDPDRTILRLEFRKDEKKSERRKQAKKTSEEKHLNTYKKYMNICRKMANQKSGSWQSILD